MYVGSGSLFSILLLCRIMDIALYGITLISSNVCLMFILGIYVSHHRLTLTK